jgi:hypothetical protein
MLLLSTLFPLVNATASVTTVAATVDAVACCHRCNVVKAAATIAAVDCCCHRSIHIDIIASFAAVVGAMSTVASAAAGCYNSSSRNRWKNGYN